MPSRDSEEEEEDVAYAPRQWVEEVKVKRVRKLPIKHNEGVIIPQDEKLSKPNLPPQSSASSTSQQQQRVDDYVDEDEDYYEEEEEEEEEEEKLPAAAPMATVEDQLQQIAKLGTSILADEPNTITTEGVRTNAKGEAVAPERTALDQLMAFARGGVAGGGKKSAAVPWAVRKAAWLSLLAVFKDMLPWEYVRELTEKELQGKATKETRQQRATERILMTAYKNYVHLLLEEETGTGGSSSYATATFCMCHLLEARGTLFNWADVLLQQVLTRACGTNSKSSNAACCIDCIDRMLQDDPSFEATLTILKRLGRIYEKKSSRGVSPALLQLFSRVKLSLDLKDEKRMQEIDKAKKHRKDKKRRLGADLNKLLEETDVSSTRNHEMHQRQMEIIRELFTLYLRILTTRRPSNGKRAPLTIQALRGARKLVQLVNIEFIHAIVRLLSTFEFEDEARVGGEAGEEEEEVGFDVCVALETCETGLTALQVLSRPELRASRVECQEDFFTVLLSRCLGRVRTAEQARLVFPCAQLLFFRRREMDMSVVAVFCKTIVHCAMHVTSGEGAPGAVALMLITLQRQLVERYPGVKDMLMGSVTSSGGSKGSSSKGGGAVVNRVVLQEEEACGPLIPVNTAAAANAAAQLDRTNCNRKAWELDLLARSHFDVAVSRSAGEAREFKPVPNACRAVDLLEEHDTVRGVLFHPMRPPAPQEKQQRKQQPGGKRPQHNNNHNHNPKRQRR